VSTLLPVAEYSAAPLAHTALKSALLVNVDDILYWPQPFATMT
jgi:hypothetical protein